MAWKRERIIAHTQNQFIYWRELNFSPCTKKWMWWEVRRVHTGITGSTHSAAHRAMFWLCPLFFLFTKGQFNAKPGQPCSRYLCIWVLLGVGTSDRVHGSLVGVGWWRVGRHCPAGGGTGYFVWGAWRVTWNTETCIEPWKTLSSTLLPKQLSYFPTP